MSHAWKNISTLAILSSLICCIPRNSDDFPTTQRQAELLNVAVDHIEFYSLIDEILANQSPMLLIYDNNLEPMTGLVDYLQDGGKVCEEISSKQAENLVQRGEVIGAFFSLESIPSASLLGREKAQQSGNGRSGSVVPGVGNLDPKGKKTPPPLTASDKSNAKANSDANSDKSPKTSQDQTKTKSDMLPSQDLSSTNQMSGVTSLRARFEAKGAVIGPNLPFAATRTGRLGSISRTHLKVVQVSDTAPEGLTGREFIRLPPSAGALQKGLKSGDVIIDGDQRYTIIKSIGSGSQAKAFLLRNQKTADEVVLKAAIRNPVGGLSAADKQELAFLSKIKHPGIVVLKSIGEEFIILEKADSDLTKWIQTRTLSQSEVQTNFRNLAAALYLMAQNKYDHGDLNSGNILVFNTADGLRLKFADFGGARQNSSILATKWSIDVVDLAKLMLLALYGQSYTLPVNSHDFPKLSSGEDLSADAKDLILHALTDRTFSVDKFVNHPYFKTAERVGAQETEN